MVPFPQKGCLAINMVNRGWNGNMCMAKACPLNQLLLPLATELIAICAALNWFWNVGCCRGEIFTNSRVVVKLLLDSSCILDSECFWLIKLKLCCLILFNYVGTFLPWVPTPLSMLLQSMFCPCTRVHCRLV